MRVHINTLPWQTRLMGACLVAAVLPLQADELPPNLSDLTPSDIRQAAIALVNIAITPGVDGAQYNVGGPRRDADLSRSSLGFGAEFTLRDRLLDGYWGAEISAGDLDETLSFQGTDRPLELGLNRRIESLQGSAGLVFPIDRHFRLRPFFTGSFAKVEADTRIRNVAAAESPGEQPPQPSVSWTADAYLASGTLEAIYDRWFDHGRRLELEGAYTLTYTTIDSDNEVLRDSSGWHDTLVLRARWSAPTDGGTWEHPWRWNTYATYVLFPGQAKSALGFRHYLDLGVGISYGWNIKALDWFGVRSIGIKAGIIVGDDVDGYSIGVTFQ